MEGNIIMKWKSRKNGFSKPLNALQILAWTIYLLNVTYFGVFVSTMHKWYIMIVVLPIYVILSIMVFRYAFSCMLVDPIDPIVVKERKCRAENQSFCKSDYEFYCSI